MTKRSRRITAYVAIGVLILIGAFFSTRSIIVSAIRERIQKKIDTLNAQGYRIHYDSLYTDPWANTIGVSSLSVKFPGQDSCSINPVGLSVDRITVHGIDYLAMLFRKQMKIHSVTIQDLIFRQVRRKEKKERDSHQGGKIRGWLVQHLYLTGATVEMVDSANCNVQYTARFDLNLEGFGREGVEDWKLAGAHLLHPKIHLPEKYYTFSADRMDFNSQAKTLVIDSFQIVPDFDKIIFAKKTGVQTDRLEGRIPSVTATGFEIDQSSSVGFRAREVRVSLTMAVFRDKRYPFVPKLKSMPVEFLHSLPITINIDSLHLEKSEITYSEFPEGGTTEGKITFHDLVAEIHNLSNTSSENTTMQARTRLMDKGNLSVNFVFPSDSQKPYSLAGSLKNFNMAELNVLLIPMAQAEVKSGFLNELAFQYQYNAYRADGSVTMDYKDLTVASLSKNDKSKTNKIATLILQSFILKKDMDKDQRKGTILFYRDNQRSIFNYWWKAVWSGVKSLFNLDRIMKIDRARRK